MISKHQMDALARTIDAAKEVASKADPAQQKRLLKDINEAVKVYRYLLNTRKH